MRILAAITLVCLALSACGPGGPLALSEDFWRQRFGAGPDIIGTSIEVDGAPATIICVLPRGFDAPPGAKFWYSEPLRAPAPDNQ